MNDMIERSTPEVQALPAAIDEHPQAITLYQIVIVGLVVAVLLVVVIGGILAWSDKVMPSELTAIGMSAVVGLVGMIAGQQRE
ncbi:MAG: hypothetical protein WBO55_06940 [Rhizobiaceae bacterium]